MPYSRNLSYPILIFSIFFIFNLIVSPAFGSEQPKPRRIFLESSNPSSQTDSFQTNTLWQLKSRNVQVDFDHLSHLASYDTLSLNLFPDVVLKAKKDRVFNNTSGSQSWVGHIADQPLSTVSLVLSNDILVGNIVSPEFSYQIRKNLEGGHIVHQINPGQFPPGADPIPVNLSDQRGSSLSLNPLHDDGSVVDVLVIYSDDARDAAGGTATIETLIDLAETETNTSYTNSGINHTIRIVHREEISYDESGFTFQKALDDVTDGVEIPQAQTLREQHGADLVSFWVAGDNTFCGLAWLMTSVSSTFAPNGYSVVAQTCATGNFSFGHEIGHNSGARHDRASDPTDGAPFDFNHGFVDSPNNFKTIMGIGSETRVQFYSNPEVNFSGNPTGVAEGQTNAADNRKTLNQTALTVAQFRDSVASVGSSEPIFEVPSSESIFSPFWQSDLLAYSFISVSHPSLSAMNSQIGMVVKAIDNDGNSLYGSTEFTIQSSQTERIFIVATNNLFINPTVVPNGHFITGTQSSRHGQLLILPKASHPKLLAGNSNSKGRGFPDITMLHFWGAIVVQATSTGFAMEFIGDNHDSNALINSRFSGVN